jgi:hypothetical protein
VNPIRSPSGDESFRVSNARFHVLFDVALDVLPFAITEAGVALCSEVDGEDTIAPEDIGAESRQTGHGLIVRGRGDLVGLEEVHARRRQFNGLSQINADQLFHPSQTHGGVLQDVDGGIVAVVSNRIAQREGVNTLCVWGLSLDWLRCHHRIALTVACEFGLSLQIRLGCRFV